MMKVFQETNVLPIFPHPLPPSPPLRSGEGEKKRDRGTGGACLKRPPIFEMIQKTQ